MLVSSYPHAPTALCIKKEPSVPAGYGAVPDTQTIYIRERLILRLVQVTDPIIRLSGYPDGNLIVTVTVIHIRPSA